MIEIKKEELEELCMKQTTKQEIISYYATNFNTMNEYCKTNYGMDFNTTYKRYTAKGKIELKKILYKIATDNEAHATKQQVLMLIFLSKALLDLKEDNSLDSENMSKVDSLKNLEDRSFY